MQQCSFRRIDGELHQLTIESSIRSGVHRETRFGSSIWTVWMLDVNSSHCIPVLNVYKNGFKIRLTVSFDDVIVFVFARAMIAIAPMATGHNLNLTSFLWCFEPPRPPFARPFSHIRIVLVHCHCPQGISFQLSLDAISWFSPAGADYFQIENISVKSHL